jgi:hypothetical protein
VALVDNDRRLWARPTMPPASIWPLIPFHAQVLPM